MLAGTAIPERFDNRLSLIDFNGVDDPRPDGFRRPSEEELAAFRDALRRLEIPVVRRYSVGAATHSACGMLVARRGDGTTASPPGS